MRPPLDGDARDLLAHVLLPVADDGDALATARALEPYRPSHVTTLHAVEQGGGVPDETPVSQSEALARRAYATVRTVFPDADDHTAYARDVVGAIFDTAEAVDATAVAYRSRGGGRIVRVLSGDRSRKLATNAECPVIALPRASAEE